MGYKKITFFIMVLGVAFATPVFASGNLVKSSDSSTVYYLDGQNIKHPFPTENTYKSWYKTFTGITVMTPNEISRYGLGDNVTVRPGVNIVNFQTDKNFYAVEPGGVLRQFMDDYLLEVIYGKNWSERLLTLPDSFFGDYSLGKPIKDEADLPDGLVYKLSTDGRYYFKNNGIIQPFKDEQSILDNNFQLDDVVYSGIPFNDRRREIAGFDERVFNPIAPSNASTADCENKDLKVAFVFVVKDGYSAQEIEKITALQKQLADTFDWATDGLADIDVNFPLVVLKDDGYILSKDYDGQLKPDNETINTFYDDYPDIFDFIILYNNFVLDEPVIAKFLTVTNDINGTGNSKMHSANVWGSRGKLKGIANMGNLDKYSVDSSYNTNRSVNYIIHELLHYWSGRAKFINEDGELDYSLLEAPNYFHWNMYVDFISPLGGNGWTKNASGDFVSDISIASNPAKKKLSDLDLYFMGLLPKRAMAPVKYLVPNKAGAVGNVIGGQMKEVTIEQIEEAMGEWSCRL